MVILYRCKILQLDITHNIPNYNYTLLFFNSQPFYIHFYKKAYFNEVPLHL